MIQRRYKKKLWWNFRSYSPRLRRILNVWKRKKLGNIVTYLFDCLTWPSGLGGQPPHSWWLSGHVLQALPDSFGAFWKRNVLVRGMPRTTVVLVILRPMRKCLRSICLILMQTHMSWSTVCGQQFVVQTTSGEASEFYWLRKRILRIGLCVRIHNFAWLLFLFVCESI